MSKKTYVDNAMNRRLGRVGKPLGSCIHRSGSSSSSGPHGYSGQRTYVDNPLNRSLGRVGEPLGSCVHRSGSSFSSGPHGYSGQRTYVDNPLNRSLGRVGEPLGSCVHRSGSSSSSGPHGYSGQRTYVDNPLNRSLGRVGEPLGSCVHRSGSSSSSGPHGYSGQRTYVDNPLNRSLGRVGEPLGSCVQHGDGSVTSSTSYSQRVYVDNGHNKKLNRVGKPIPSRRKRVQEVKNEMTIVEIKLAIQEVRFTEYFNEYQYALDDLQRKEIEENWMKKGINPSTDQSQIDREEIIPYCELDLGEQIGKGGFGEVFAGLWKKTAIAYKKLILQHMSKNRLNKFMQEIKIFSTLHHPNVVQMFGAVVEEGVVGTVMEYLKGSLYRKIFMDRVEFCSDRKKCIISQVASALMYLHNHDPQIGHCDVKSENILLDQENNAKLSDFGLSVIKNATQSSTSGAVATPGQGTPRYSAPEVLRGELLSTSQLVMSDMYSLALVAYEVLTEEEPYEDLNPQQLQTQVGRGNLRPVLESTTLSQPVMSLLQRSWDGYAARRPTAEQFHDEWNQIDTLYKD